MSPGVDEARAIVVTVELCLAMPGHVKYCVHRAWRNGEWPTALCSSAGLDEEERRMMNNYW
jgi:hypothetical protein